MSLPTCVRCGQPLTRVDHYGIEHTILDNGQYRDVAVYDGGVNGEEYGTAGETDLRCGFCGVSLTIEARQYFYKRWVRVIETKAIISSEKSQHPENN